MPMTEDLSHHLPAVIEVARSAGQLILDIYEKKEYQEFTKSDETPVTSADIAAHKLIVERLSELTPDIPVLSEEAADISLISAHNGTAIGWWTRWMALKSSSLAVGILRPLLP